jgi:tetratricopeptide (TPR) repeat protein
LLTRLEKYEDAEASLLRAVEIQEKYVANFPSSPEYRLALSDCHQNLGVLYARTGENEKSDAAYQDALRIQKSLADQFPMVPVYRSRLSRGLNSRGNVLKYLGKQPEADAAYREALEIQEKLVAEYAMVPDYGVDLGGTYCNFGIHLIESGQPEASLEWFQKATDRLEAVLLKEPRLYEAREFLRNTHFERANAQNALGQRAEALESREKALELSRGLGGPSHPHTLTIMSSLIDYYDAVGRFEEALRLRKEILTRQQQALSPDDPATLGAMANVANGYANLGRHEEALKLREEVLALMRSKIPDHQFTLTTMNNLAGTYTILGRHDDALALLEELLAIRKTKFGPDDPETLGAMANVAVGYFSLGRHKEALKQREEVLALMKAKIPEHPYTYITMSNLAESYAILGRHEDALELRQETLALRQAKLGLDHADTLLSMHELAANLIQCDRGAEAVPLIDECVSLANGKAVDPNLIPGLIDLRLRHFEKQKDASGCRATAQMWEVLQRSDANSLYSAACFRAVTAAVLRATDKSDAADSNIAAEAEKAMDWLAQAVAAGFTDVAHINEDKDLHPLREREDFKELLAELQAKKK